jgi:hypothetical protein
MPVTPTSRQRQQQQQQQVEPVPAPAGELDKSTTSPLLADASSLGSSEFALSRSINGSVLSPTALLKRLHTLERTASAREQRDAQLVQRLQADVAELEMKLLECYATQSQALATQYSGRREANPSGNNGGDSPKTSTSGPPELEATGTNQFARRDQHHHINQHDAAVRTDALIRREERLQLDRKGFEAEVRRLETSLSAWEHRLRQDADRVAGERAELEAARKKFHLEKEQHRDELNKQKTHVSKLEGECKALVATLGNAARKGSSRHVAPPPSVAVAMASKATAQAQSAAPPVEHRPAGKSRSTSPDPGMMHNATARGGGAQPPLALRRSSSPGRHAALPVTASSNVTPADQAIAGLNSEIEECDRLIKDAHSRKIQAQAKRTYFLRHGGTGTL